MAVHRRRREGNAPGRPPLQTKVTIVGQNAIFRWESPVASFLAHTLLGPSFWAVSGGDPGRQQLPCRLPWTRCPSLGVTPRMIGLAQGVLRCRRRGGGRVVCRECIHKRPLTQFESEFAVLAGSVHLHCLVAAVCWCGEVRSNGRRLGEKEEQCWVQLGWQGLTLWLCGTR